MYPLYNIKIQAVTSQKNKNICPLSSILSAVLTHVHLLLTSSFPFRAHAVSRYRFQFNPRLMLQTQQRPIVHPFISTRVKILAPRLQRCTRSNATVRSSSLLTQHLQHLVCNEKVPLSDSTPVSIVKCFISFHMFMENPLGHKSDQTIKLLPTGRDEDPARRGWMASAIKHQNTFLFHLSLIQGLF